MDPQYLELELQALSEELTAPRPAECLSCYLERMLAEFGCARHRFTRRWAQDRKRGTEDGLVRCAVGNGGCCCDCEVVMNALTKAGARRRGGALCEAARQRLDSWDEEVRDAPVAACTGSGRWSLSAALWAEPRRAAARPGPVSSVIRHASRSTLTRAMAS